MKSNLFRALASSLPTAMAGCLALLAVTALAPTACAQFRIDGVVDRTVYTDRATFEVIPEASHQCTALLNGQTVPVAQKVDVTEMDHYELEVRATPKAGGAAVTRQTQFIVLGSDRGRPETGLPRWKPVPPIPSAAGEFAGATLELVHPARIPAGLDLPVVARLFEPNGHARRANGTVRLASGNAAAGSAPAALETFRLMRGVGFGLSATRSPGRLEFTAGAGPLTARRSVTVEPRDIPWTSVSGALSGTTRWPADARISVDGSVFIPSGGELEIGPGAIIRLMPGVNVTNLGRITLLGTLERPILFTATNRVAPEQHAGAWGGFLLRGRGSTLAGAGAIFTGSGSSTQFPFARGTSHRREQALFHAQAGARVLLTNCFIVNQAGQIGNGQDADFTFDHCLLQRAITAGEFVGGRMDIEHSALVEFPSIDDRYDAKTADGDYDAIYFTTGRHRIRHSLFAWAKDDAIDSGTGGAGTAVVTNCWIEAAWHEGLAWSGGGRETWTLDTVVLNSGQGLECGWSTGDNSPLCTGERLLLLGNAVGARYGDNYEGTTRLGLKRGFLWLTNSVVLHNRRDVWGRVWDDTWSYRTNAMDIRANWLTRANPWHPENTVWNPATDAPRLRPFLRTPTETGVGLGLAVWTNRLPREALNDLAVALSSFTPAPVAVEYAVEGPQGPVAGGTLRFAPGSMVERIPMTPALQAARGALTVTLSKPVNGELTGLTKVEFEAGP